MQAMATKIISDKRELQMKIHVENTYIDISRE